MINRQTILSSITSQCILKEETLHRLTLWLDNKNYMNFVQKYSSKIKCKLNAKNPSSLEDNLSELYAAYIFFENNSFIEVYYEEYKSDPKYSRSPDFTIRMPDSTSFNIEHTRINYTEKNEKLNNFLNHLYERITNLKLDLAISYSFPYSSNSAQTIYNNENEIIDRIICEAIKYNEKFSPNQKADLKLEGDFTLTFEKLNHKNKSNKTKWSGGNQPIFYNRKEYYRFADIICDKVKQLIPNQINFIFINAENDTHGQDDFVFAMEELVSSIKNKKFAFLATKKMSSNEFLEYFNNLDGIIFKSRWPDRNNKFISLWLNPFNDRIPTSVKKFVENFQLVKL